MVICDESSVVLVKPTAPDSDGTKRRLVPWVGMVAVMLPWLVKELTDS